MLLFCRALKDKAVQQEPSVLCGKVGCTEANANRHCDAEISCTQIEWCIWSTRVDMSSQSGKLSLEPQDPSMLNSTGAVLWDSYKLYEEPAACVAHQRLKYCKHTSLSRSPDSPTLKGIDFERVPSKGGALGGSFACHL